MFHPLDGLFSFILIIIYLGAIKTNDFIKRALTDNLIERRMITHRLKIINIAIINTLNEEVIGKLAIINILLDIIL